MITKEIQARVDEYLQEAREITLSDLLNTVREDGFEITRREALKLLREHNLEPHTGLSINGQRARLWRKRDEIEASSDESEDENEDENEGVGESDAPQGAEPQSKVASEISRVNTSNEELLTEKQNLLDLVQKSIKLKKEIREQQKQLLMEMSQLVQAMYGDSDAD